jgi:hypothetical protein
MRKSVGLLQPFALAILAAVGFGVLWAVLVLWITETIRSFQPSPGQDRLLLRADGTPLIEHVPPPSKGPSSRAGEPEFRDLAGTPVTITPATRWLEGVHLPLRKREDLVSRFLAPDEPWDWRTVTFADRRDPQITWYFLCDGQRHGRAYLVAYDVENARRVGYLGPDGFREGPLSPAEQFPFDGTDRGAHFRVHNLVQERGGAFLPMSMRGEQRRGSQPWRIYVEGDDNRIYQIDLEARSVRVVLEGKPIRSSGLLTRAGRAFLAVRTDEAILLLDSNGQITRSFPLADELREANFTWFETAGGGAMTFWYEGDPSRPGEVRAIVSWFDADGHRTRQEETELYFSTPKHLGQEMGIMLPMPLALDWLIGVWIPLRQNNLWTGGSYSKGLAQALAEYGLALVGVHGLAAVLAGLTYHRLVRYGADRGERLAWPLFVFVFGLPGWVAFRFGRSWPVRERCPECGAVVPRDRSACAVCRTSFPLPALKGTEVFA